MVQLSQASSDIKEKFIIVCSLKVEIVRSKHCIALPGDLHEQICTSWPPKTTSNKCSSQKMRSWGSFPNNGRFCGKLQWFIVKHYIYKYIHCGDNFKTVFLPTLQKCFSVFSPCQLFKSSLETFTGRFEYTWISAGWRDPDFTVIGLESVLKLL